MPQNYTPEFKKKIVRLIWRRDAPIKVSLQSMAYQKPASPSGAVNSAKNARQAGRKEEYDYMKEMLKLRKENEELRKENLFLKKAAAFFAKEID